MHSCEYGSGAWFRSINHAEEDAFFDPGVNQYYGNKGLSNPIVLISVVNSKRGHYLTVFWDTTNGKSIFGYSSPSTFWNQ